MSLPLRSTSPKVGLSSVATMLRSVVFPDPDSPIIATYSPSATSKQTFSSAVTRFPPNLVVYIFFRFLTSSRFIEFTVPFGRTPHDRSPVFFLHVHYIRKGKAQPCFRLTFSLRNLQKRKKPRHSAPVLRLSRPIYTAVPTPTSDSARMTCPSLPHTALQSPRPIPEAFLSSLPALPV